MYVNQQHYFHFRFLYFFVGPPSPSSSHNNASLSTPDADKGLYADIGISLATAITDKDFAAAIYNAKGSGDILVRRYLLL